VLAITFSPDGKRLISGSADTTALVWDLVDPLARRLRPARVVDRKAVTAAWADLASTDGVVAFEALRLLAAAPQRSLPLLREHLRPAVAADDKQTDRLLADLNSPRFATREEATRELERLDEAARPALQRFLARSPAPEARRRAERLLERLDPLQPERLRLARSVEVLEAIANEEARQLLEDLARGAPGVDITADSRAALQRMGK
jgi:hypothetical protein